MKLGYLFILFITINLSLFAQTQARDYGFNYDFSNKVLAKSFLFTGETFKTKIENGLLYLTHTKDDEEFYIFEVSYINWKKDFTIATTFKLVSGKDNNGYGIAFGAKNTSNTFVFEISDNGYYCFFKIIDDKITDIKKWTETPNIIQKGKTNIVEIKKEGINYNFYINKKLTYSYKAEPFFDFNYGYYINGKNVVVSDYFVVSQKQTNPLVTITNPHKFGERKNLGKNINTSGDEIAPIISADEKTLYFERSSYAGNKGGINDGDIWYSKFNVKDSTWGTALNTGFPLNNKDNNFVQHVSHDNNTLIVGNKYTRLGEYLAPGYSISHKTRTGWSIPKGLVIKNYYNLNQYNEICLSPNGKVMLLAIQRYNTEGVKDIYVSFMQTDSTWSEPKNIGKTINTFADEVGPFIASDGVTMYFSSAGHPGFGSNDIFMTKRLDDTWMNWSSPKNLGPKINSSGWDAYYTIPASGKNAYIVSEVNGNSDLYILKQPESAKPNPVFLLSGIVINSITKKPMEASIHYSELGSEKILGHSKSDPLTGKFTISLPKGKKYCIIADKENYYSVHENTDVINLKNYKEHEIDLYLTPIKKGQTIIINNLFFNSSSAQILPESYAELNKLVNVLKNNPRIKIQINGHTSKNNSGQKWNLDFSTNRALAVKKYLVSKGISENRIIHKGFGFDKPIYKQTDEEHLAKNRRVEFTITDS